jgi:hypothetical protein
MLQLGFQAGEPGDRRGSDAADAAAPAVPRSAGTGPPARPSARPPLPQQRWATYRRPSDRSSAL